MADQKSRSGHSYLVGDVLKWTESIHSPHDLALEQAFQSPSKEGLPQIQISPSEGHLLSMLLQFIKAKKVIEIGTLAGYSTLWLSKGLVQEGHIWTIESNTKHGAIAEANFKNAMQDNLITLLQGNALEILPSLEQEAPFDAVFIDADKANYKSYAEWGLKNLRKGGLLIGDNAYLFGKLLNQDPINEYVKSEKTEHLSEAQAMRDFHILTAKYCESVCIPTPDGMVVGIKK